MGLNLNDMIIVMSVSFLSLVLILVYPFKLFFLLLA